MSAPPVPYPYLSERSIKMANVATDQNMRDVIQEIHAKGYKIEATKIEDGKGSTREKNISHRLRIDSRKEEIKEQRQSLAPRDNQERGMGMDPFQSGTDCDDRTIMSDVRDSESVLSPKTPNGKKLKRNCSLRFVNRMLLEENCFQTIAVSSCFMMLDGNCEDSEIAVNNCCQQLFDDAERQLKTITAGAATPPTRSTSALGTDPFPNLSRVSTATEILHADDSDDAFVIDSTAQSYVYSSHEEYSRDFERGFDSFRSRARATSSASDRKYPSRKEALTRNKALSSRNSRIYCVLRLFSMFWTHSKGKQPQACVVTKGKQPQACVVTDQSDEMDVMAMAIY